MEPEETEQHRRGLTRGELRKRIRRHSRDDLLRGIGRVNAGAARSQRTAPNSRDDKFEVISESYSFMLAGICVSIGKNRSARVTDRTIEELVNDLFNMADTSLDASESDEDLQRIVSRTAYLQMPFQNEPWPPLMRTLCLFGDNPRFGAPAIEKSDWQRIVGASVGQFVQIGFLMYVAAVQNGGAIKRTVFDASRFDPIVHPLTIDEALAVVDEWLAEPIEELASAGSARAAEANAHWSFNPFFEHPIALLDDGTYVMPSPLGVLQRLAPQGVLLVILDAINSGRLDTTARGFTNALGERFERYIGEQLELLQHITLHSEVTYNRGQNKSVEFMIETPEAIVLVEAKSTAPDETTRSGDDPDQRKMRELFRKACGQISRTAQQIEQGNPKFPPQNGRPIRGLIVTREHYYNLPMMFIGDPMPTASVPTTVWSSNQLEHAIPGLIDDPDCGARLLEALAPDADRLYTATDPLPLGHNPLLKEQWDQWKLAWPQRVDAAEDNRRNGR